MVTRLYFYIGFALLIMFASFKYYTIALTSDEQTDGDWV